MTTRKIESSSSASSVSSSSNSSVSNINHHIIIKTATCSTLSGKSLLNYHIGYNSEGKPAGLNISFRISANDGGGYFSSEWVSYSGIQQALTEQPEEAAITSMALRGLFKGKSVNTSAFLMAALKAEGLLAPVEGKKRHHQLNDPGPFMAEMKKLIAAKTDLKVEEPKEMIQRSRKPKS